MCTGEVTVLAEGAATDAQGECDDVARVVSIDWNSIKLNNPTDLVIAPMDDTEMASTFGIPVDDQDKKENGKSSMPTDGNRDLSEDVDGELMEGVVDDVDDAHDDELVNFYDKENIVIAVGKLFPNMKEFRMCFNTFAFKHEFDAKTKWTDKKKFYARCRGFDESVKPCKWYISARHQPNGNLDVVVQDVVLQNESDLGAVMQNKHDVVLQNEQDDIPADVLPTELILEVVLPTEDML
ncbi:hypothetical protein D1007_25919 [Hordeum vulgare]|nr:hypothetical protein D1007_25919 [Hordeum vulgare]